MGLFGELLGAAAGSGNAQSGAPSSIQQGLIEHVLGMASNSQAGGLNGLIAKLNAAGLSSAVSTWVGNGANQPVSADQIQAALGNEHIAQLAQKFGVTPAEVASHLSQILPGLINHLTPDGNVPQQSAVQSAIGLLKGKLFG